MAKEYDPDRPDVVVMKVRRVRRGGSEFWSATCKEHNHTETGFSEAEAVRNFANHLVRHPGSRVEKV